MLWGVLQTVLRVLRVLLLDAETEAGNRGFAWPPILCPRRGGLHLLQKRLWLSPPTVQVIAWQAPRAQVTLL